MADPGFLRGFAKTVGGGALTYFFWHIFDHNCMKKNKMDRWGGSALIVAVKSDTGNDFDASRVYLSFMLFSLFLIPG